MPMPSLRAGQNRRVGRDRQDVLELAFRLLDVRVRQIDLVDDRDDRQVLLRRQMHVGDRLRLDALRRVHDQQRAFAGRQAARHFVGEIHVARRVDQVQLVRLAVLRLVGHRHRMRLDGDAALAFEVHRIEHLLAHLAFCQRARRLQQPVRQRRLAVINVGDDAEIPYVTQVHEAAQSTSLCRFV